MGEIRLMTLRLECDGKECGEDVVFTMRDEGPPDPEDPPREIDVGEWETREFETGTMWFCPACAERLKAAFSDASDLAEWVEEYEETERIAARIEAGKRATAEIAKSNQWAQFYKLQRVLLAGMVFFKLLGVLEWSWWWIAAPLWLPAIVMFSFVAGRVVAIELELGGWKKKDGWQ